MEQKDIEKCYFLPFKTLQKVISFLKNSEEPTCHNSLLNLQASQNQRNKPERGTNWFYRTVYWKCIHSAIYSHDWDKLLYFLKKRSIMDNRKCMYNEKMNYEMFGYYQRAYTILLMNHPYAKENFLLDDYLHMVLSCRTPAEKQAVMKVLTTLTDTLYCKVTAKRSRDRKKDMSDECRFDTL